MKIFIYRDPAVTETFGGAMLEAMNAAETAEAKPVVEAAPEENKPATKFSWGDEDRRKARAELKDDDEIDLGYEDEKDGVKTPVKRKLSDIRQTAKWLKENDGLIRGAVAMRNEFKNNPELSDWFNKSWGKIFDGNKYNPEAVTKLAAALEDKAVVTQDKIEDNADDIVEAEKELAELDPDSPQAKILKRNINTLKAVRQQLNSALDANKQLQGKIDGLDKFKTGFEDTQKKEKEDKEAKQAADLFDTEFGALTSKEDGYKFEDSDDTQEFEDRVRDTVATLAAQEKITNDDEFKKAIADASKAAFERISKRNERIVTNYLKKKGKLPPEKEVKEEKETVPEQSIGESIASAMFGADKK